MSSMRLLDSIQCEALVIGGGIAGCWTALKLAERGIDTVLVYYDDSDRGGRMGSTIISVGAINTSPLTRSDFIPWLEEMGRGQMQSSVAGTTVNYLAEEITALQQFDPLKPIELGFALKSGSGKKLVDSLMAALCEKDVTLIKNAWVTRIDADESSCRGVQYQLGNALGCIAAASIVLAPGGYSGLFQGAVKTGTYGSIHGRFLLAGGKLSNLEFVFKHGYGQPDLGKLTPTEELPGVEIYDANGTHVSWLEEELFCGRGTHNHFQAFMTWRKDENVHYFVDFRFRDFHRLVKTKIAEHKQHFQLNVEGLMQQFSSFVADDCLNDFIFWLMPILLGETDYTFSEFCKIKPMLVAKCPVDRQRIRQIAYFSMGGIMHHGFLTNLKNVFVNGEAMHDYGAHRVGGLPWALYLSAARKIADDICNLKKRNQLVPGNPCLSEKPSHFDGALLQEIQSRLFEFQERGQGEGALNQFLSWLRRQRHHLDLENREFDDCYAYLALAEAIVISSVVRKESRGCFFRSDYPDEDFNLRRIRTIASYDNDSRQVYANCVDKSHILNLVANQGSGKLKMDVSSEKLNAAHFLLKKHLSTETAAHTAIIYKNKQLSYEELNRLTEQYAYFLFSLGLAREDRVAIFLNDSPDWIAIFLACLQLGLIAVPLNTFAKEQDLIFYLNDSQATLLLTEQSLLSPLDIGTLFQQVNARIMTIEDIHPLTNSGLNCCVPVDENTPGFMLFTSGSTGNPKGAVHRHTSLQVTAQLFAGSALQPETGDKFYSSSRLFFAYGLGNSLTFPLYFGCTSVLSPGRLSPAQTLSLLGEQQVTHFFSIPSIYNAIYPELANTKFPTSVKVCVSAGEPLSRALANRWVDQTKCLLIDGLGSTEALHIFCCSYFYPDGSCSQGQPVDGYQLELLDDNNFVITKNGITGNLAVRGKSLANGYWQKPEATSKAFVHDLLLTGDQYQLSDASEFMYVGRKSDMFKSSGLWVSAYEIELAMRTFDYIAEAALVVYNDVFQEQKTAAFITPRIDLIQPQHLHHPDEFREELAARLLSDLGEHLSRHKLPRFVYVVNELPRTATGKISKPLLKEMALSLDPLRATSITDAADHKEESSTEAL